MPEHISITDAARRFGPSEKSIRNWIKWGWLGADRVIIEGRAHQLVNVDELLKLIKERGIPLTPGKPEGSGMTSGIEELKEELKRLGDVIYGLENKIESLEDRLNALRDARDDAPAQETSNRAPQAGETTPRRSESEIHTATLGVGSLPSGWVGAQEFNHGIPFTTVLRWVRANGGQSGSWLSAQHKKVTLALPPDVQHNFYLRFSQRVDFQPCDNCPHKPQEKEQ